MFDISPDVLYEFPTEVVLKGDNSALSKQQLLNNGFTADNNNKKRYRKEIVSPNGLIKVTFRAYETLGIREMKNAYTVVKFCYDNRADLFPDGRIENTEPNSRTKIKVSAREILKFTNERTTLERRKNLAESLSRVSNMSYTIEKRTDKDGVFREDMVKRQWFYDISTSNNYEDIEIEVSNAFIKIVLLGGLTFNLKKMMEFNGRGMLLYSLMQSQRHLIPNTDPKKYVYNDYISHEVVLIGLDLQGIKSKRLALQKAKEAFKEFEDKTGVAYSYNRSKNYWKKMPFKKLP